MRWRAGWTTAVRGRHATAMEAVVAIDLDAGVLLSLREAARPRLGGLPARGGCLAGRETPQRPTHDREAVVPIGGAPIPCAARIPPPCRRRWCRRGSHRVAGIRNANTSSV